MDKEDYLTISEKEVERLARQAARGNETASVEYYDFALLDYQHRLAQTQSALESLDEEKGNLAGSIRELRLAIEGGLRAQWSIRDLTKKIQDQMVQVHQSKEDLFTCHQQFSRAEGNYREYLKGISTIIKEGE